jgi:uncharacterized membrane protein
MAAPEKKKTSMGMEENIASLLAYLFGIISGLIFYFGEKENKTVRFHALQSILWFVVFIAVYIVFSILGGIFLAIGAWGLWSVFGIINTILWLVWFGITVFLMVKAYTGGKVKLPIIGDFAEKQVNK